MFPFAVALLAPFFPQLKSSRFPCANGGQPMLGTAKGDSSSDSAAAFRCQCPEGYYGTFCEYRTDSGVLDTPNPDRQQLSSLVDKFGILFPPGSVSADTERRAIVPDDWHWQDAIVNLLVCVFFLLILPSLVVYIVRILYLLLKRCHHRNRRMPPAAARPSTMPTPPPQYFPPVERSARFRQSLNGRHRSESPGITEFTVQLPASVCRPLHGTHSLNLRPTTSLTLHEFHGLLLAMQREMVAEQRRERENQSLLVAPSAAVFALSPAVPPIGPPPNYESALLSSHYP